MVKNWVKYLDESNRKKKKSVAQLIKDKVAQLMWDLKPIYGINNFTTIVTKQTLHINFTRDNQVYTALIPMSKIGNLWHIERYVKSIIARQLRPKPGKKIPSTITDCHISNMDV